MKYDLRKLLIMLSKQAIYALIFLYIGQPLMFANDIYGQSIHDVYITIKFEDATIEQALKGIEERTKFRFAYGKDVKAVDKTLDQLYENKSVAEVLKGISNTAGIAFRQINGTISAKVSVSMENSPFELGTQLVRDVESEEDVTVSGTVTDENGNPIVGVNVVMKGTTHGAITDIDGRYSIEVAEDAVLVFSSIGFVTQEVSVNNRSTINIQLAPSTERLDEIVVVAYGETSKRLNTGSVGTIDAKVIEKQPVTNPILALHGTIPGLFLSQAGGKPGAHVNVLIRGVNSINGSDPLYVIDGIPFSGNSMNQFSYIGHPTRGNQSPLNSINPDDIESISVLKDADATAIYGSRGANGVILITTKKRNASDGKLSVSASILKGVQDVGTRMDLLSTREYLALRREALENDGLEPNNSNAPDLTLWDQNRDMDWQDYLIGGTAGFTHLQLGLRGGTRYNSFSVNGSYRDQGTVYRGDYKYRNYNLASRYDLRTRDEKFHLGLSVSYNGDDNDSYAGDLGLEILLPPNFNPYNEDGTLDWTITNPLAQLNKTYEVKTTSLRSNIELDYHITNDLSAKVVAGYIKNGFDQNRKEPSTSINPAYQSFSWGKPFVYQGNTERTAINVEPQLNYIRALGKHTFSALLGGTLMTQAQDNLLIFASQYSSDAFLDNIAAAGQYSLTSNSTDYRYSSLFGRVNYNYDNKYILNASVRRDGSSRFGPNQRFGNFGAVGAAWLFSEENFLKGNPFLSYGKLRTSYGTTGNDNIGDYGYYQLWTSSSSVRSEVATVLTPSGLANNDYSWEKVTKFDFALELGFFQNRILLNANYYNNKTTDQLVGQPLPSQTGFTSINANLPALIRNTGYEFSLNAQNINKNEFKWNTTFTLTLPKNELEEFENLEASTYANTYVIGEPITLVKGYLGSVNPDSGEIEYEDISEDGAITFADDRAVLGSTLPEFYGGFRNTFSYNGLELSFMFQFVKQEGFNYLNGVFTPMGSMSNFDNAVLNRWQQPGDATDVPAPTTISGGAFFNSIRSSLYWGDASYIKLRNVNLAYDLPKDVIADFGLESAKIYFQGQNLWTITNYKGLDPETQGLFTPPLRVWSLGVQLDF